MRNLTKLQARRDKLQAIVDRSNGTPKDAHLDALAQSFHLGTVGGSGRNTASLNRCREASLERTISNAVKNCQARKDLVWVKAQIFAIENAPARAEVKAKAEERMKSNGAGLAAGVKPGDFVRWIVSGTDCKVIRVNPQLSVTVEMCGGVDRLKFSEITAVTPVLPAKPERGNSAVTRFGNPHIGRALRIPAPVMITDLATGCITLDIVKNDFDRNGSLQMQADLAEARKNGVKLTPEAEEYVRDVLSGNISGTGYPMGDSDW